MKQIIEIEKDNRFPIYHNGKKYNEQDCGDVFLAFYTCIESLRYDNAVYVGDRVWVLPDDTFKHD
jgi:hypothetical protein